MTAYAFRSTWVRPGAILGSGSGTCGDGRVAELWGCQGLDARPCNQAGVDRADTSMLGDGGIGGIREGGAESGRLGTATRESLRGLLSRGHGLRGY